MRDGRAAVRNLHGHYLGINNVDNMSSCTEWKLKNATYSGKTRRFTFEKYVKIHVDQHAVLESLTVHGYAGIDDRSKVRHLMEGIKTNSLDTVKAQIMAHANLRTDFNVCVNLYQDFIEQMAAVKPAPKVTIASLKSGKDDDKYGGVAPDMSIEDCYYTTAEYAKLSAAKKVGLAVKREKRGHKPGSADSKRPQKKQKTGPLELSKSTISAIAAAMSRANPKDDDTDDPNRKRDESCRSQQVLWSLSESRQEFHRQ